VAALINDQDGAYRRGLILGFTMAEIITLVLFALLLAFAVAFTQQEDTIVELRQQVAEYASTAGINDRVLAAAELIERTRKAQAPDRDPEQYFTELVIGVRELDRLQQAMAEARQKAAEAERRATQAERDKKDTEARAQRAEATLHQPSSERETREAIARAGFGGASPKDIESALTSGKALEQMAGGQPLDEIFQTLTALNEAASASNKTPAEIARDIRSTALALNDARGVVATLERQLGVSGNGRVLPACWSDPTKKPEYVFDVKLASTGLQMQVRPLADRRQQLVELLGSDAIDRAEISNARFLAMTKKMFEWSVAHNCRFYVLVYDATAEHEKAIYKARLKVVEGHFYKLEVDGMPAF
jgi:hypothetical protein